MSDHSLPILTSAYALFLSAFNGRIQDSMLMNDPATTSVTNAPTNAIRWNSASSKWEKYNGTTWAALTATFAINISGSAASAAVASAVAWGAITSKPTTLGGFGITDGAPLASPNFSGTPQIAGVEIGYRDIPLLTATATAALAARGCCYDQNQNITIPAGVFLGGASFMIECVLAITIIQGASLTLRFAGTNLTGNRSLAAHGLATVWFRNTNEAVISGAGLT